MAQDHNLALLIQKRCERRFDRVGLIRIRGRSDVRIDHRLGWCQPIRAQVINRNIPSQAKAAQQSALAAAVMLDKSSMLEQAHLREKRMSVEATKEQAALVAAVIKRVIADIGVPSEARSLVNPIVRHYLQALGDLNADGQVELSELLAEFDKVSPLTSQPKRRACSAGSSTKHFNLHRSRLLKWSRARQWL